MTEIKIDEPTATPHVYKAIRDVQAELAETGIAKTQEHEHQKYMFRGILVQVAQTL